MSAADVVHGTVPESRLLDERTVSALALGGAGMSIRQERDDRISVEAIRTAAAEGITLFDTARAYTKVGSDSHNEDLFASALRGRDEVVIATKGGHFRIDEGSWGIDGRPEALRADCEHSLRHLKREQLDLYFLHHPDPQVPLEESVGELVRLQKEGKIHSIGLSNVSIEQLTRARRVASISAVENRFSALDPAQDRVAGYCATAGILYLGYSPLAGVAGATEAGSLPDLAGIATRRRVSPQCVLLSWLLTLRPWVLPIVGATRPSTVTDSAQAMSLDLTPGELELIDGELRAFTHPAIG